MGLSDLRQGAAVSGYPAQLVMPPDSPYLTSVWSEGVIKWTSMTAYLPLCSLAGAWPTGAPPWRQQKAHCGGVRRVRAGAHPEQRILRSQLQLLCPLVLYASAHPCGDDRECAGRPQHRSGHPGPGPWLDHAGYAGLCTGARAGQRHRHLVSRVLKNPGQYFVVLGFGLGHCCSTV